MKLHADVRVTGALDDVRLVRTPVATQQAMRASRQSERVLVPLEVLDVGRAFAEPLPRPFGIVDLQPTPADLDMRRAVDDSAEGTRQQLAAEAVADDRHAAGVGVAQQRQLRLDPRQLVIDAHVAAERTDPGIWLR